MPENTLSGADFIVSELLSELKEENTRKDIQILKLYKTVLTIVIVSVVALLMTVGGFLWYLNLYDFSSTTTNNAEGVYAIVDSDGNTIATDISPEEMTKILEDVNSGNSDVDNSQN